MPRTPFQILQQRLDERQIRRERVAFLAIQPDLRGQHLLGLKAERRALQAIDAANQQAGANQQHQRERDFRDDQCLTQTAGLRRVGRAARARTQAVLQRHA